MVKNEKFQCPSESWGPEDFKAHPTFVLSAIFRGVMASQNMGNFFLGHPVVYLKVLESSSTQFKQESRNGVITNTKISSRVLLNLNNILRKYLGIMIIK